MIGWENYLGRRDANERKINLMVGSAFPRGFWNYPWVRKDCTHGQHTDKNSNFLGIQDGLRTTTPSNMADFELPFHQAPIPTKTSVIPPRIGH